MSTRVGERIPHNPHASTHEGAAAKTRQAQDSLDRVHASKRAASLQRPDVNDARYAAKARTGGLGDANHFDRAGGPRTT